MSKPAWKFQGHQSDSGNRTLSGALLYVMQYCFWAGNRASGPLIGKTSKSTLRPAEGPIVMFSLLEFGQNPSRKSDFRPGSTIA